MNEELFEKERIKYVQTLYSTNLSITYDRPYGTNQDEGNRNIPYNYDFSIPFTAETLSQVESSLKFHYVGSVDDTFYVYVNNKAYKVGFDGWNYSIGNGYLTLNSPASTNYHITHSYYNVQYGPTFLWLRACTVTIEWITK